MNKIDSPCYGCTNRTLGCHGECKEYGRYKHELIEYKRYMTKQDVSAKKALSDMYWQSQTSKLRK